MIFQVMYNGACQLGDAFKGASPDAMRDLGKEALDYVKPGGRCQREVQVEARMRLEAALYGRALWVAQLSTMR